MVCYSWTQPNNLSSVPNEVKRRIYVVDIHDSYHVMACYTAITSVENTINKLHIMYNFYSSYIHNLYHDKQESVDYLFFNTLNPY